METVGGAEPRVAGRRDVARRIRWVTSHSAGVGLLLAVGVWLGMSLWVAPVQADGARLRAAADGGQIVNLDRLSSPPKSLSQQPLFLFGHPDSTSNTGSVLVWTTRNWQRHYTDATTVPGPFPNDAGTTSGTLISGDGSNPSPTDQVTAYVLQRTRFQSEVAWVGLAQLVLVVVAIGAIRGAAPQRGTRWFWFWVINLPLGVGVLWYALSERLKEPAPVNPRWNGGQGFAVSVVGTPLIQLAIFVGQLLLTRM